MKLSDYENFEATKGAWDHYSDALRRIDGLIRDSARGVDWLNGLSIHLAGAKLLDDADECFGVDDTRDEILRLMRRAAKARLLELADDFRSIDVEVDWLHGLPADLVAELAEKSGTKSS